MSGESDVPTRLSGGATYLHAGAVRVTYLNACTGHAKLERRNTPRRIDENSKEGRPSVQDYTHVLRWGTDRYLRKELMPVRICHGNLHSTCKSRICMSDFMKRKKTALIRDIVFANHEGYISHIMRDIMRDIVFPYVHEGYLQSTCWSGACMAF